MSPGLRQGLVAKSASAVWLLDDDPSVLKATGRLLASADWEVETLSTRTLSCVMRRFITPG